MRLSVVVSENTLSVVWTVNSGLPLLTSGGNTLAVEPKSAILVGLLPQSEASQGPLNLPFPSNPSLFMTSHRAPFCLGVKDRTRHGNARE